MKNELLEIKNIKKIAEYWIDSSKYDFETAKGLFKIKRYSYCLFMCHLSVEKLLKALFTVGHKKHAPFTHNLVYLAEQTELYLAENILDILADMNEFNIEARYPDIKSMLYKKADRKFTKRYLDETGDIRKCLLEKLEV